MFIIIHHITKVVMLEAVTEGTSGFSMISLILQPNFIKDENIILHPYSSSHYLFQRTVRTIT